MSTRGIYCVAFGGPARQCAVRLINSVRLHMPGLPVALCAAEPLGVEDIFLAQEDTDVGGRRAKLRAYELAPAEWEQVLYLDADTELMEPVTQLFDWLSDGWEFIICRDAGDTLHSFARKNNLPELYEVERAVGTLFAMQFNGGVWAMRRCPSVERFMAHWRSEWEVHRQRDQGALIRAFHTNPMRTLVLGNVWNCLGRYTAHIKHPAIMHYPMDARRWVGKLPGAIDSSEAWQRVAEWEDSHGHRPSGPRAGR